MQRQLNFARRERLVRNRLHRLGKNVGFAVAFGDGLFGFDSFRLAAFNRQFRLGGIFFLFGGTHVRRALSQKLTVAARFSRGKSFSLTMNPPKVAAEFFRREVALGFGCSPVRNF
jgi:hypothetical protein